MPHPVGAGRADHFLPEDAVHPEPGAAVDVLAERREIGLRIPLAEIHRKHAAGLAAMKARVLDIVVETNQIPRLGLQRNGRHGGTGHAPFLGRFAQLFMK